MECKDEQQPAHTFVHTHTHVRSYRRLIDHHVQRKVAERWQKVGQLQERNQPLKQKGHAEHARMVHFQGPLTASAAVPPSFQQPKGFVVARGSSSSTFSSNASSFVCPLVLLSSCIIASTGALCIFAANRRQNPTQGRQVGCVQTRYQETTLGECFQGKEGPAGCEHLHAWEVHIRHGEVMGRGIYPCTRIGVSQVIEHMRRDEVRQSSPPL